MARIKESKRRIEEEANTDGFGKPPPSLLEAIDEEREQQERAEADEADEEWEEEDDRENEEELAH